LSDFGGQHIVALWAIIDAIASVGQEGWLGYTGGGSGLD
jgi:hypothetical protein